MSRFIGLGCDPSRHFFKITNANENHKGFQYKDGLNILQGEFSIEGSCVSGGLYFTTAEYIYEYLDYGVNLRDISLPFDDPDLKMVEDPSGEKWRADRIILGAKYPLSKIATHEYLISKGASKVSACIQMHAIACREANFDSIKYLLAKNYVSLADAQTVMIHIAQQNVSIELAQTLAAEGVPEKEAQKIILEISLEKKEWDLAGSLIKNGAQLNDYAISYNRRLIASSENIDLIKIAIDHGIDLSYYAGDIIHCAIKSESLDLIKWCISTKYISLLDENSILCESAVKGNFEMFQFVFEYFIETKCEILLNGNLLNIVSRKGYLDFVKYLINKKSCDQKIINKAIHKAINANQMNTAKFLFESGAKINRNASDLMISAVEKNSLPMVKFLIENRVNFKVKNESPLCLASEKGYLNIVKYLVEKGSNVKANRNEAICRAVSNNHLETVRFLHENGAKIHVRNDFLIKTATEKGYTDMIHFLMGNGVKGEKGNKGITGEKGKKG